MLRGGGATLVAVAPGVDGPPASTEIETEQPRTTRTVESQRRRTTINALLDQPDGMVEIQRCDVHARATSP